LIHFYKSFRYLPEESVPTVHSNKQVCASDGRDGPVSAGECYERGGEVLGHKSK